MGKEGKKPESEREHRYTNNSTTYRVCVCRGRGGYAYEIVNARCSTRSNDIVAKTFGENKRKFCNWFLLKNFCQTVEKVQDELFIRLLLAPYVILITLRHPLCTQSIFGKKKTGNANWVKRNFIVRIYNGPKNCTDFLLEGENDQNQNVLNLFQINGFTTIWERERISLRKIEFEIISKLRRRFWANFGRLVNIRKIHSDKSKTTCSRQHKFSRWREHCSTDFVGVRVSNSHCLKIRTYFAYCEMLIHSVWKAIIIVITLLFTWACQSNELQLLRRNNNNNSDDNKKKPPQVRLIHVTYFTPW